MSDTDSSLEEEREVQAFASDDSSYNIIPVIGNNDDTNAETYEDDVDDDDWGTHSGNSDLESDTETTRHGNDTSDEISDNESTLSIPTHTSYNFDESCNGSPTEPDDDVMVDSDSDTNYAITNSKLSSLTVISHKLNSDFVAQTDDYDPSTNGSELTTEDEEKTCDITYKYETGVQIQHNGVRPLRNYTREECKNQSSYLGATGIRKKTDSLKSSIATSTQYCMNNSTNSKNNILPFIGMALVGGALAIIPNLMPPAENFKVLNSHLPYNTAACYDLKSKTNITSICSTKDMYSHWFNRTQDFTKLVH